MTRKVVATLFSSVDGVASDPYLFQYDSFDADLGRLMTEGIAKIDEVVMGRVTYNEWSGHWPDITEGDDRIFADFINGCPKHVASTTLTPADMTWQGSQLIEGDLLDAVRALKERDGADVGVQGSLSVVRQLVAAGLMDELTLIVHPAVAGTGRRLFDGADPQRLRLISATTTEKGNILATYGPFQG